MNNFGRTLSLPELYIAPQKPVKSLRLLTLSKSTSLEREANETLDFLHSSCLLFRLPLEGAVRRTEGVNKISVADP